VWFGFRPTWSNYVVQEFFVGSECSESLLSSEMWRHVAWRVPTVRKVLLPSSRWKSAPFTVLPWRQRQDLPPRRWYISDKLYGVTYYKILIFIVTGMINDGAVSVCMSSRGRCAKRVESMGTQKIRIYCYLLVSFVRIDKRHWLRNYEDRNSGLRSNCTLSKGHT